MTVPGENESGLFRYTPFHRRLNRDKELETNTIMKPSCGFNLSRGRKT